MARPKSPDGRRVTIAARFSESEAAVIGSVLGGLTRSEWLRAVAVAAANGERDARLYERTGIRLVVDERMPEGVVSVNGLPVIVGLTDSPAVPVYGNDEEPGEPCQHPAGAFNMNLGMCGECGQEVD